MPLQQLTNFLDRARDEAEGQERLIDTLRVELAQARRRVDELAAEVRAEKARANGLEIERNLLLGQKAETEKELGVPVSRLRPTEHWMHRAK